MKLHSKYYVHLLTLLYIVIDFVTIEMSFYCAYFLWRYANPIGHFQPLSIYILPFAGWGVLFIIIFALFNLYKRDVSILNIEEPIRLLKAMLLSLVLFLSMSYFFRNKELARLVMVYSCIFITILVNIERIILNKLHEMMHKKGVSEKRVLVYGAGAVGTVIVKRIKELPRLGYKVVGFIDDNKIPGAEINGYKLLGGFNDIMRVKEEYNPEMVIIAMPSTPSEWIKNVIYTMKKLGLSFKVVQNLYDIALERSNFDIIGGIPLLDIKEYRPNIVVDITKRICDIIISSVVILFSFPLFIFIGIK